jgi:Domain of unknown function (DUF4371)/EsV-1-7 cysteine-rich motif
MATCEENNCSKVACFGWNNQKTHCSKHQLEGMVWTLTSPPIKSPEEPNPASVEASNQEKQEAQLQQKEAWSNLLKPIAIKPKKAVKVATMDSSGVDSFDGNPSGDSKLESNQLSAVPSVPRFTITKKGGHIYGMKEEYFNLFPTWLRYDESSDRVYCLLCKKFPHLIPNNIKQSNKGASMSNDSNFCLGIPPSLIRLDKLKRHCDEAAGHIAAVKAEADLQKPNSNMAGILYTLKTQMKKDLVTMFDTVVFLCQNERPLTDFPKLEFLEKQIGRKLAVTAYRHNHGAKEFVLSMAEDLQAETVREIKDSGYFSVITDEATDVTSASASDIYVRYLKDGQPITKFLCLVPINCNASAANILRLIDETFCVVGFQDWKDCLIALGCDGASVNTGIRNGIGAQLKASKPYILVFLLCCSPP